MAALLCLVLRERGSRWSPGGAAGTPGAAEGRAANPGPASRGRSLRALPSPPRPVSGVMAAGARRRPVAGPLLAARQRRGSGSGGGAM